MPPTYSFQPFIDRVDRNWYEDDELLQHGPSGRFRLSGGSAHGPIQPLFHPGAFPEGLDAQPLMPSDHRDEERRDATPRALGWRDGISRSARSQSSIALP